MRTYYDLVLQHLLTEIETARQAFIAESSALAGAEAPFDCPRPGADAFQRALQKHWLFTQEGIAPAEFSHSNMTNQPQLYVQ